MTFSIVYHCIFSSSLSHDSRLRCGVADFYFVLFGRYRPSCLARQDVRDSYIFTPVLIYLILCHTAKLLSCEIFKVAPPAKLKSDMKECSLTQAQSSFLVRVVQGVCSGGGEGVVL